MEFEDFMAKYFLPVCHWCFDPVAPADEVGDGDVYIAHAECHEIQT